jgi:hypothetical protein
MELKLTEKEKVIYEEAKHALKAGIGAVKFSNLFFSPQGRLRALWKTQAEKEQVVSSDLYRWLQKQLATLRTKEAKLFEQEIQVASLSKSPL